jgi:uncharacterized damage-inducible protein DinB
MFLESQFRTLFSYHFRTTRRLIEQAAKLSDAEYHDHPGYGHGSIHDLLFHVLRTDRGWRMGLESGRQQASIRPDDFCTLASLQNDFESEQRAWEALLNHYTEQDIQDNVTLTQRDGNAWSVPRWRVLQHLVLHGMQHHTEVAQLLTAKGLSPGDLDFIFFPD